MKIEDLINSLENAENDNKKFALLLILSELIKSNKLNESIKTDKSLNKRLFNSIGAHFLARLLATKQLVENSSIIYKSVCLSILTQFLEYPDLITDPVLLTKIDSIFEILKHDFNKETGTDPLKLDAFKYVFELSKICPDFLYQNGLIDVLINHVILNENYSSKEINPIYDFDEEIQNFNFAIISCKIISNLIKDVVENKIKDKNYPISKTNDKLEASFGKFLDTVSGTQTEFKFVLINYLNYFLSDEASIQKYIIYDEKLNQQTSKVVFDLLNDLFKNKVKQVIIDIGFILLNNYVKIYDFELIYMKNRNFFYLLIHLLCIQIGMNLQFSSCDQIKIENQHINKMSILYSLLEKIITILSTASPFDTGDESEDFSDDDSFEDRIPQESDNYEPEFKRVIKIVVEVLETIILFIKDFLLDDFSKMDQNLTILLVSSIRVLLCWMSYESLLEDQIMDIMPKIIKFSDYLKKSEFNLNIFQFLSPGLNRILNDKKYKFEHKMKKSKSKADIVKFEFENKELNEEIEIIQSMLDKCNYNSNILD